MDTVGDSDSYERRLRDMFPSIQFTVCKKADSIYPITSAASICAKVGQERHVAYLSCSGLYTSIVHLCIGLWGVADQGKKVMLTPFGYSDLDAVQMHKSQCTYMHTYIHTYILWQVSRDQEIKQWEFREPCFTSTCDIGSGYPAGIRWCMYVCMYVWIYVCICVCVCVCMYIYIYIYIHVYMYSFGTGSLIMLLIIYPIHTNTYTRARTNMYKHLRTGKCVLCHVHTHIRIFHYAIRCSLLYTCAFSV